MAKKTKKVKDVAKFGGVDNLGTIQSDLHSPLVKQDYDTSSVEAKSEETHLEDDKGEGNAVVIRCFTFQMNMEHPEIYVENPPTKQQIFNSHLSGIEMALWKDGLRVYDEVAPRMTFDVKKLQYSIFVPAIPARGHVLFDKPQTLSDIVHGI